MPDSGSDTQIALPVLNKCYPNPFNPSTTISFILPQETQCNLSIYNVRGQKIKTIVNEIKAAGNYKVVWDGKDSNGTPVASGMYLYRLSTPKYANTNKMMLLK